MLEIAYETIITNFSKGNLKEIKSLLDKKIFNQFNDALNERKNKGLISEATFVLESTQQILKIINNQIIFLK